MIADQVGADNLADRLAMCGRTVIDRACPVCGGMYLQGESLVVAGETIGMTVRCSMPGCRAIVSIEYNEDYKRKIEEAERREEAQREEAARRDYEGWFNTRRDL